MNEKRGHVTKRGLISAWLFVITFLSVCLHPYHSFAGPVVAGAHWAAVDK
jgi:hypothetical protein